MARDRGTTVSGGRFSEATKIAVWLKGATMLGRDGATARRDAYGAEMHWVEYGQTSAFGWEIDHVKPVAAGGSDELANLQPLQWENNRKKGDTYPAPERKSG